MWLDFSFVQRNLPLFLDGMVITVQLAGLSIAIALVWGLAVALARRSRLAPLRWLASAYIELVRNTPVLVQIYFIYFGFAVVGLHISGFLSALIALSAQNAGYLAEIYRAGIQSISVKQIEAAKALGMRWRTVMSMVVLPQAVVRVIPPIGNQSILIIKDTSLASTVAVAEMTQIGKMLTERTAAAYEVFFTLAILYLLLTGIVAVLFRVLERRLLIYH
jgi:His/Glu/Gln/Arg/opine family amino acid ABC transporter permease subunit